MNNLLNVAILWSCRVFYHKRQAKFPSSFGCTTDDPMVPFGPLPAPRGYLISMRAPFRPRQGNTAFFAKSPLIIRRKAVYRDVFCDGLRNSNYILTLEPTHIKFGRFIS